MSGWKHQGLGGKFDYIPPEQVREMANRMDHPIPAAGARDQIARGGFPGKFNASHAEAQHLPVRVGQPIGVTRNMCGSCQSMFQHTANYTDQPLLVKDPNHTHLFLPGHDKALVDPRPDQFPRAHPVTGDDVCRGLHAGAGAAPVTPHDGR
jgi:hypothetical protein